MADATLWPSTNTLSAAVEPINTPNVIKGGEQEVPFSSSALIYGLSSLSSMQYVKIIMTRNKTKWRAHSEVNVGRLSRSNRKK